MDAETRRRAVIDLALEYSNMKQRAIDIGIIGLNDVGGLQMNADDFINTFSAECKVQKRKSEWFPYEAYVESYSGRIFAVLSEEQYWELEVEVDE